MPILSVVPDGELEKVVATCQKKGCDNTVDTHQITYTLTGFETRNNDVWIILCEPCNKLFKSSKETSFEYFYPVSTGDIASNILIKGVD